MKEGWGGGRGCLTPPQSAPDYAYGNLGGRGASAGDRRGATGAGSPAQARPPSWLSVGDSYGMSAGPVVAVVPAATPCGAAKNPSLSAAPPARRQTCPSTHPPPRHPTPRPKRARGAPPASPLHLCLPPPAAWLPPPTPLLAEFAAPHRLVTPASCARRRAHGYSTEVVC